MNWKKFDIFKSNLPAVAGCYVVYFDDELVYVGQSRNIRNRFSEHKFRHGYGRDIITPWVDLHDTVKITLKIKRSKILGDWAMWEIRLIERLRPRFNRHHKGRAVK